MNSIQQTFQHIQATQESKDRVFANVTKPQKKHALWKPILAIATACVLFFTVTRVQVYANVVSYVSVDVNPSIELGLNRYDQVVSVVAYNEESQALCDSLSLKDKTIEEALSLLLENDSLQAALNENALYITVTSDQGTQLLETIESLPVVQTYHANCQGATSEVHNEAHDHGMTVSRYNAYLLLQENGVTISEEEINTLTMNQIHQMCLDHGVEDAFDNCQGNGTDHSNDDHYGNDEGNQNNGHDDNDNYEENYQNNDHSDNNGNNQNNGHSDSHENNHNNDNYENGNHENENHHDE